LLRVLPTDNLAGMQAITNQIWMLRVWKDSRAQDLIEYALMAGFLAVGVGALMGNVAAEIIPVFSKVASVVTGAVDAGQSVTFTYGAKGK
jgi:Flp pilus assembly pilin Flp